jgi:phytoene synthase
VNALIRDEARRVMAVHARTFSAAAWFLPPGSRNEVAVLYAVCRRIDDAADEQADRAALDEL